MQKLPHLCARSASAFSGCAISWPFSRIKLNPNEQAELKHLKAVNAEAYEAFLKKLSNDFSPDRNDQFLYLGDLRGRFQRRGIPIISVDIRTPARAGAASRLMAM
jgi:hypothetical protein